MFLNMTGSIQYLDEVKEILLEGFEETLKEGPLAFEEVVGLKFKLVDASFTKMRFTEALHKYCLQLKMRFIIIKVLDYLEKTIQGLLPKD